MNWLKRLWICSVVFWLIGCGVKGDPLPPEKPMPLGRGRPTYRRAAEKIKIDGSVPARGRGSEEEDEDDDKK